MLLWWVWADYNSRWDVEASAMVAGGGYLMVWCSVKLTCRFYRQDAVVDEVVDVREWWLVEVGST